MSSLDYSKIFSTGFKYNDAVKQADLTLYAASQVSALNNSQYDQLMKHVYKGHETGREVLTMSTDVLDKFSPSKGGEVFRLWLSKFDPRIRDRFDSDHVLVMDKKLVLK